MAEEEGSEEEYSRMLTTLEEKFFAKCDNQLSKVNNFYAEKLAEATRRFAVLQNELEDHRDALKPTAATSTLKRPNTSVAPTSKIVRPKLLHPKKEKMRLRTMKELKFAFTEFYLSLVLIQNYQQLNFTGFRKILKKHDKVLKTSRGAMWRQSYVETSPFYTDMLISDYIKKTEDTYINELEGGDRTKAMKRLRVPPLTDVVSYPKATVFKIGLYLGMTLVLFAVFVFACYFIEADVDLIGWIRFYRFGFICSLFCAYIGLNILGWRHYGVNHVLIFEIDPRQHLSHQHFFELAALIAVLWTLSSTAWSFSLVPPLSNYIHGSTSPGLMYIALIAFLFNPLPIFKHKARYWLLYRLWRLVACGYYPVEFADFWLADQLNSLVVLFTDAEFLICYYSYTASDNPDALKICASSWSMALHTVISCYPSYIRFVQCLRRYRDTKKWFPHLVNAGKYSTSFFKNTFKSLYILYLRQTHNDQSVYFFLWIASQFISSCYTYAWDIKMDWGLWDSKAGENKFLREEIVYQEKSLYYFAIIENLVIRFSWIVMVAIAQTCSETVITIASHVHVFLEVTRRFIWNFFRLENEHINNCGEFRAVRDISITPFHNDDIKQLETVVDESDGAESVLLDYPRSVGLFKRHRPARLTVIQATGSEESAAQNVYESSLEDHVI